MRSILLTNDDGYSSCGIAALYKALSPYAKVIVIAPTHDKSGSSHAVTLKKPVPIQKFDHGYHLDSFPADCVYFAIHHFNLELDLVVSGINHGENLGDDIFYSGTIGAAREAAINGLPGIAVSYIDNNLTYLNEWAAIMAEIILQKDYLNGHLYSYNLPTHPTKDVVQTKAGKRCRNERTASFTDNRGKTWVWFSSATCGKVAEGTDFKAISDGKISLTTIDHSHEYFSSF